MLYLVNRRILCLLCVLWFVTPFSPSLRAVSRRSREAGKLSSLRQTQEAEEEVDPGAGRPRPLHRLPGPAERRRTKG